MNRLLVAVTIAMAALLGVAALSREHIVRATHYGAWTEGFDVPEYHVSNGRAVVDRWLAQTRVFPTRYFLTTNETREYEVNAKVFSREAARLGGVRTTIGYRHTANHNSRMIEGDPYDYVAQR